MRFRILSFMFIVTLLSFPVISFANLIDSNSLIDQKTSVIAADEQGDDGDEDLQDCCE